MSKDLYENCFSLFQHTNLNSVNKIAKISGRLVAWLKFEYIPKVLVLNQSVSLKDMTYLCILHLTTLSTCQAVCS